MTIGTPGAATPWPVELEPLVRALVDLVVHAEGVARHWESFDSERNRLPRACRVPDGIYEPLPTSIGDYRALAAHVAERKARRPEGVECWTIICSLWLWQEADYLTFAVRQWRTALNQARAILPTVHRFMDDPQRPPLDRWTTQVQGELNAMGGMIHPMVVGELPATLDTSEWSRHIEHVRKRLHELKSIPAHCRTVFDATRSRGHAAAVATMLANAPSMAGSAIGDVDGLGRQVGLWARHLASECANLIPDDLRIATNRATPTVPVEPHLAGEYDEPTAAWWTLLLHRVLVLGQFNPESPDELAVAPFASSIPAGVQPAFRIETDETGTAQVLAEGRWSVSGRDGPRASIPFDVFVRRTCAAGKRLAVAWMGPTPAATESATPVDDAPERDDATVVKLPELKAHDRQAWQLSLLHGMTQAKIADALNREHGTSYTQGRVSKMIARAKAHAEASGLAEMLAETMGRPRTVDPARLELGRRVDKRKPRPGDLDEAELDD